MNKELYKILDQCVITNRNFYIYSKLTQKKLFNAFDAYGKPSKRDLSLNNILALYDNTVFGSAKEGFLISTEGMHFSIRGGYFISYDKINSVSSMDKFLLINGVQYSELTFFNMSDMAKLVKLIQNITEYITGAKLKDDKQTTDGRAGRTCTSTCTNLSGLPKRIYYTYYY